MMMVKIEFPPLPDCNILPFFKGFKKYSSRRCLHLVDLKVPTESKDFVNVSKVILNYLNERTGCTKPMDTFKLSCQLMVFSIKFVQ